MMKRNRGAFEIGIGSIATAVFILCFYCAVTFTGQSPEAHAAPDCDQPNTPFCSSKVPLPPGWSGHVFSLSQSYPSTNSQNTQPWLAYDPMNQPAQYLKSVLAYFYEGNLRPGVEDCFDPHLNTARGWYNAPWQDFGLNGREPIHGLTRERVSLPQELAPTQTHRWNNYAVGFYNAPGGVIIGKVWAQHDKPNPTLANFPNGTVAAKLLFTTAPVSEVPYLQGAPAWNAYVYANPNDPAPQPNSPRAVQKLRLLQIDIAVKDSRVSNTTGWVFGTFVYGGGPGGASGAGWTNVSPVGVMWGNDPNTSMPPLTQTWLNPAVHMPHVGYQGRLNGPVDNKISSCLSCHSTAEFVPPGKTGSPMVPPTGVNPAPWFINLPSGKPFDAGCISTDYSLQLAVGISNFRAASALHNAPNPTLRANLLKRVMQIDSRPPRDGGPLH